MKKIHDQIDQEQSVNYRLYTLVIQLATRKGFIEYYFQILPRCRNNTRAFDMANQIYYLLLKEYRYSSYNSFKRQVKSYLKKSCSKSNNTKNP